MAARGWTRRILDRRSNLINDQPNRAVSAKGPLDAAQERHFIDDPMSHMRGAYHHSEVT
jgi:hypothetical protein